MTIIHHAQGRTTSLPQDDCVSDYVRLVDQVYALVYGLFYSHRRVKHGGLTYHHRRAFSEQKQWIRIVLCIHWQKGFGEDNTAPYYPRVTPHRNRVIFKRVLCRVLHDLQMESFFAGLRILPYLGIRIKTAVNHYYVGKEKSDVSCKFVCET